VRNNQVSGLSEVGMVSEARTIDIADIADLGTLVEEIRRSRTPRILRHDGEDVAVLMPLTGTPGPSGGRGRRLPPPTAGEIARSQAGIRAAAGSWKDIDVEKLKDELRHQRGVVTRSPVEL
jgi:hypothetical protein